MKIEQYTDEDIEFAIQLICHPERVNAAEARAWLNDEGHRKLLQNVRNLREAGFTGVGTGSPDIDGEWEMFRVKHVVRRKQFRGVWIGGVAAAAVILISSLVWMNLHVGREEAVPLAGRGKANVTISTNEGEKVIPVPGLLQLNEHARKENIFTDSIRGVSYMNVKRDSSLEKEYHTLRVPARDEFFIQFADGTKVWLNSDTELRYPRAFDDTLREVELLKGEAYFQVNRDEKRPFVVKTDRLTTRVLGTEFNVQAYTGEPMNVTLVKGSVIVNENKKGVNGIILEPGENASLQPGGLVVEKVDVQSYVAWKDGYFYFNNVRLEEILDKLGYWYGFSVFYRNQEVKDYRFKFWANRKDQPENVIERLNELGTLDVRWEKGHVIVTDK